MRLINLQILENQFQLYNKYAILLVPIKQFPKLKIMGKQYNKLIKRRRRAAYLARRKKAGSANLPEVTKKPKSTARKAPAKKKTESKPKEKAVAEKAKATDVLGPDAQEAAPEAAEVQENKESVEKASEE